MSELLSLELKDLIPTLCKHIDNDWKILKTYFDASDEDLMLWISKVIIDLFAAINSSKTDIPLF